MEDPGAITPELTLALRHLARGEVRAEAAVLEMLVSELRAIAAGYARGQREGHTLQATALVNEAFVKLCGSEGLADVQDRKHFFRIAARAMRQILVDHARRRSASKREGAQGSLTVSDELIGSIRDDDQLLDLDLAVGELAELDPRQAQIVELRFFAGLEVDEVAALLGVSKSTVEREWRMARAWLARKVGAGPAE